MSGPARRATLEDAAPLSDFLPAAVENPLGLQRAVVSKATEVGSMEEPNEPLDFAEVPFPMPKEKPVHEVRLGAIKAAIWKNDTPNGVRYNVTFVRLYRDNVEWKTTESFGRDDLLVLAKVADCAHSWIHEQRQEDREEDGKRLLNK